MALVEHVGSRPQQLLVITIEFAVPLEDDGSSGV